MKYLIVIAALAAAGAFAQTDQQVDAARAAAALERIDKAQQEALREKARATAFQPREREDAPWPAIFFVSVIGAGLMVWLGKR